MKIKKIVMSFLLISSSLLAGVNSSATAKVSAVVTNREPKLTVVQGIQGKTLVGLKREITGVVNLLVEAYEDTTGTGEADIRIVYPSIVEMQNSNAGVNANKTDVAILSLGDIQGATTTRATVNRKLSVIRTPVEKETSWALPYSLHYNGVNSGVYTATVPLIINYN